MGESLTKGGSSGEAFSDQLSAISLKAGFSFCSPQSQRAKVITCRGKIYWLDSVGSILLTRFC